MTRIHNYSYQNHLACFQERTTRWKELIDSLLDQNTCQIGQTKKLHSSIHVRINLDNLLTKIVPLVLISST